MMPIDLEAPQNHGTRGQETHDTQAIFEAIRAELVVGKSNGLMTVEPKMHNYSDIEFETPPSEIMDSYPVTRHSIYLGMQQGFNDGDASNIVATSKKQILVDSQEGIATNQACTVACIEVPRSDPSAHIRPAATETHPQTTETRTNKHAREQPLINTEPSGTTTKRKMDVSQQTPTQLNEDRDYHDDVCASIPTSPAPENLPDNSDTQEQTLLASDSGAVNFDLGRPSSQISEDGGFENTRGDWRSQNQSNNLFTPFRAQDQAFETPALPKNPFAAAGGGNAAPFAGSQLFGQTQFSSAMKRFSPTSSRPSPNILADTFSPAIAETSPLKNRHNVSSPTVVRSSSPNRLEDIPQTVSRLRNMERIEEETPAGDRSSVEDVVPESPTNKMPKLSATFKPLAHYEPMKKSQERKTNGGSSYTYVASESDTDGEVRRRDRKRKAGMKRAQAAQEMQRVSFTRSLPNVSAAEKPSRKKRRMDSEDTANQLNQTTNREAGIAVAAEMCIIDSQTKATSSTELPMDGTTQGTVDEAQEPPNMEVVVEMSVAKVSTAPSSREDMILATSPTVLPDTLPPPVESKPEPEPELPVLPLVDTQIFPTATIAVSSSLPNSRPVISKTFGKRSRQQRRKTVVSSSATDAIMESRVVSIEKDESRECSPASVVMGVSTDAAANSEIQVEVVAPSIESAQPTPVKKPSRRRQAPAKLTVPKSKATRGKSRSPVTPLIQAIIQAPDTGSTVSSLNEPASTIASATSTPATRNSPRSDQPDVFPAPEFGKTKGLRKRVLQTDSISRKTRLAKRNIRYGSESTDDLYDIISPSASGVEKSMTLSKTSARTFRHSIGPAPRCGRIFEGMAFALSIQSDSKTDSRAKLEARITQAGGIILPDGFESLFETAAIIDATSPVFDNQEPLKLVKSFANTGFTALIADGHSRKAKYMQALALGLPCVAHHWITACLNKGEIIDWEHYLLCSGSSSVLGNAIRSRHLPPYPCETAKLKDIITKRATLLSNQRILFVVDRKKGRNDAKKPYMFLAHALGPSISRVFTTAQASAVLLEHAEAGNPFDWVYVDSGTASVESVLCAPGVGGKRKGTGPAVCSPAFGNIRILNDEIVIQSLILGRMLDGDEM